MNDKFKLTDVLRDITMAQTPVRFVTFDDQAWQHQSQLEQQRYEEEEEDNAKE